MYFKISKKEFLNSLNTVAKAISNFSPLPAFSGIKIEVLESSIIFTASDSDISIQSTLHKSENFILEIKDMGNIVIEAKYLLDIVRKINSDIIEVEMIDQFLTKISGGSAEFKINGINPLDYPDIDFTKPGSVLKISIDTLKDIITETIFATSDSETKPVLTGVNFLSNGTVLKCAATDSYRLAKKIIDIDHSDSFNLTIPAKSLQEVFRIIENETEVEIYLSSQKAQFISGSTILQTRLIDGAYPDIDRLIPDNFTRELIIEKRALVAAIDRASFIKNEGINVIKFTLDESSCILSSKSLEVGSSNEILESANFNGEPLEISCNGKFVLDAIKTMKSELLKIKFVEVMRPFTIQSTEEDRLLHLILPVRTYN